MNDDPTEDCEGLKLSAARAALLEAGELITELIPQDESRAPALKCIYSAIAAIDERMLNRAVGS